MQIEKHCNSETDAAVLLNPSHVFRPLDQHSTIPISIHSVYNLKPISRSLILAKLHIFRTNFFGKWCAVLGDLRFLQKQIQATENQQNCKFFFLSMLLRLMI